MSHITSTERFAKAGPYTYTYPMKNTLIGYARCSTDKQDLSAQGRASGPIAPAARDEYENPIRDFAVPTAAPGRPDERPDGRQPVTENQYGLNSMRCGCTCGGLPA